jgi:fermentation-respiration switch protein FrsA (DUF1100 family)
VSATGARLRYGVLRRLSRHILFPRHLVGERAAVDVAGLGGEVLWRAIAGGSVEAWFLPGRGVSASRPGPVVVFLHGNGERIEDWPLLLAPYRELGVSVLLPEYRGYGRAAGVPTEAGIVEDVVAFVDVVVARPEVDASRVVLHGRSIGGGVACDVARLRRPAALVLSSTFTSIADMAASMWIPRRFVPRSFDNLACVRELDVPVLVVHGDRDRLIGVAHAHALVAAAKRGELVLYDADHNDCPPASSTFWSDLEHWLARTGVLARE